MDLASFRRRIWFVIVNEAVGSFPANPSAEKQTMDEKAKTRDDELDRSQTLEEAGAYVGRVIRQRDQLDLVNIQPVETNDQPTLRDQLAIHASVDGDISTEYAEKLLGETFPVTKVERVTPENNIKILRFWARVRAKLRYMEADAMLEARQK